MTAPKFADLKFEPDPRVNGERARIQFANGYVASVIRSPYSYGGDEGLYEAAVIYDGHLCYDTPVTDDVVGRLTPEGVEKFLADVAALPPRSPVRS